ncbi:MAG: cytochrome c-type biogenesis protein CcmH [Candidatus Eisenbacteria bacterium]|nr:cytochrome c-type biogenesis protein CcmH [Candidatus Eisenbacteria bacterium]
MTRFARILSLAALVLLLASAFSTLSRAQQEGPKLPPEKEAVAQKIFNELISPCCWTTTVAQHGSGAAPKIQAEVRQMLASGMTHDAIIDRYVKEYGERILAKPERSGLNLVVYWIPYLALVGGVAAIWVAFRRRRGREGGRPALARVDRTGERQAPIEKRGRPPVAIRPSPSASSPTPSPSPAPVPGTEEDYRRRLEEEVRRIS